MQLHEEILLNRLMYSYTFPYTFITIKNDFEVLCEVFVTLSKTLLPIKLPSGTPIERHSLRQFSPIFLEKLKIHIL